MKKYFLQSKLWILIACVCVLVAGAGTATWLLFHHPKAAEQNNEIKYTFYQSDNQKIENPDDVGVMILDCDKDSYASIMGGSVTERKGKYVQGTGAIEISSLLSSTPMYATYKAVDISAHKEGSVHISIYISYPEYLENSPLVLELSSSGICDEEEIAWIVPASVLKPGWNELYLGMEDAIKTGEPDLTAMDYFRMYTPDAKIGLSVIVDNIYATDTDGMSLEADVSNIVTASTKPGYLLDFDTLDGIGSTGQMRLSTAKTEYKEGKAALLVENSKDTFAYANLKPIDLTEYKKGQLSFSVFINDASYVKDSTIFVEITSSGTYDKKEVNWSFAGANLKKGWNEINLSLGEGRPEGGEIDWKNVNFFRIYGLDYNEKLIVIMDAISLKPPTKHIPSDGMILDCDATNMISLFSNNTVSLTRAEGEYKQGSGAFKSVGSGVEWWTINMKELVDVSKYQDGGIHLFLYVNDPSAMKADVAIELGSAGTCDVDEYQWAVNGLKKGWNELNLSFDAAAVTGKPDLSNLNFFRIYAECTKELIAMLDDVRAVTSEEFKEEVSTEEEVEEDVLVPGVILNCDAMSNIKDLYGDTAVIRTSKEGEYKEGTGAYKSQGKGQVRFEAKLKKAIDLTAYKDGALSFWLYVGDKTAFDSQNLTVEITSAGKSDAHENYWIISLSDLKENAWNELKLNFADAGEQEGTVDFAKVNYFRIFTDKIESNENALLILDHVHAMETPYIEEDKDEDKEEEEEFIAGMLWSCDSLQKASVFSESAYAFTNIAGEYKQGKAAYKSTGAGQVRLEAKLTNPVDMTDYANGRLEFELYIGNKSDFTSSVMTVEITSSGQYDKNESNWMIPLADLEENSWNKVYLNFAQAGVQEGAIDLGAVNYFRLFLEKQETNEDIVMILDNIHAEEYPYVEPVPGMILSCDTKEGLNIFSNNEFSVTTNADEVKQGISAFKGIGSGIEWWTVRMVESVDVSQYADGGIHLFVYVSDAKALKSNLIVEVSSSGNPDVDEYQWQIAGLKDGWNELALDFASATKEGNPNLSKINFFRMFAECSESITVIVDDVRAVEIEKPQAEPGVLLNCDDKENVLDLYGDSAVVITSDEGKYKEGTAAYQSKGAGQVRFQAKLKDAVDLTAYQQNGALHFWLYVGDKSNFISDSIIVEITSAGQPDKNESNWVIPLADMKENSWNEVILNFADKNEQEGATDFTSVNFFRLYLNAVETNVNTELIIDDIRAINKVQLLTCDSDSEMMDLISTVSVTTDSNYKKSGAGAYYLNGAHQVRWKMLLKNPIDISAYENGKLHFWLYVDDISKWNGLLIVELNSHETGADDQHEVQWNVDTAKLKNGWNAVSLPFADIEPFAPGNEIDYKNIRCLRIFQSNGNANGEMITSIDDICVIP